MNQHTILLLAANPEAMPRLNVDDEARDIRIALRQNGHGDAFKLEVWPAARPRDLLDGLGTLMPTVVHFSGHGGRVEGRRPTGARRDVSEPTPGDQGAMEAHDPERHGLFFQGPNGQPQFVSAAAIQVAFAAARSSVKLVVLNACYSELLADALLPHVGCVVGVAGAIGDASARQFSVGFYGALGQRVSVDQAFAQGRAAVRLDDLPDHDQPQLRVRADVDAKQLVVAAMPLAAPDRHAFDRAPLGTIQGEAPGGAPQLPPEVISFALERQRHAGFVGRDRLLARLDQLLVADTVDRWVVVTGGPGMGKSALLAAWLARREAAGGSVPHHFIRRGWANWDDPEALVDSLVAQIEARFPGARKPEADARLAPAARLAAALLRVSERALVPGGERLVLLIDGLDEYDPPPGALPADPLAAFLPYALPPGVSVLCASRPRHPYIDKLATRGVLEQIDLDDAPSFADDNAATVRAFWEQAAPELGLDARFVAQAVERAGGNLQHAEMLRRHLSGMPPEQRRVEDIPRGLAASIASAWERIAIDPPVVDGLGLLCAARDALTLDELARVAGWALEPQRRAFLRGARELLIETRRTEAVREYRLHHDSIRAHVAEAIGVDRLTAHHLALAQRLATWPAPADAAARRYSLHHALPHRAEVGAWDEAWRVAADVAFLEAKCRELGVHDAEADVARAAARCRASGDEARVDRFAELARALGRESHWLRAAPEATAALVWNRLRRSGWSPNELDTQLQVPKRLEFLRVRHVATRVSPALLRDLAGHIHGVTACVVTPDGRHIVSASYDETLKVWELVSGRVVATLQGHTNGVTACTVTPDGRHVVSASIDNMLKVWELESGREVATIEGHPRAVTACVVTPDGRHVISASWDETLKVWELGTGRSVVTLQGHIKRVNACAVTPDGRHVVSASADQTLKVWELASGCAVATLEGHTDVVNACTVTPDSRCLISASDDQTLKVWELASGREMMTLEGHTDVVNACTVTPDGRRVVSASRDRTLKVWELASGRVVATLEGHTRAVTACPVTPDGHYMVSASNDATLKIWELKSERAVSTLAGHTDWVTACAVTPDGRHAVSASADRTLKVWELGSGRVVATFERHTGVVTACAVTPDGRHVVSASWDETLKVWELASGCAVATLEGHTDVVNACTVTPDSRYLISASDDQTLKVWELESGCAVATLQGHTDSVTACAVTPNGRHVISASADQTLKLWELRSRRAVATLQGHTGPVNACAVTPDGQRVISASADNTLKVWELATGRAVATLQGHTRYVAACAVTPDGCYAVSASADGTLKVWDLATHACRITHRGDAGYLAVAVGASTIVAGDEASGVWFLDVPRYLDSSPAQERSMTREELLSRLSKLLSSQFEQVLYLARIPQEHLPAAAAAQASRAVELMRYVEQQNQLEQLAGIVQQVVTGGGSSSPDPR
jgi:WD40 repeat protein